MPPGEYIVMVLEGGWHHSAALYVPRNRSLLLLPPYALDLNPVEHLWDELREKHFHNRVFDSLDALEDHLVAALPSGPRYGALPCGMAMDY